jgi:hypothetical protein
MEYKYILNLRVAGHECKSFLTGISTKIATKDLKDFSCSSYNAHFLYLILPRKKGVSYGMYFPVLAHYEIDKYCYSILRMYIFLNLNEIV